MSPDLGHAEDDRRLGLLEMYRAAITYLDSLHDPGVQPLRDELTALQNRLVEQQSLATSPSEPRP